MTKEARRTKAEGPRPSPLVPTSDLLALAGIGLFLGGLWCVWQPLVLLAGGGILWTAAVGCHKTQGPSSTPNEKNRDDP